MLSSLRGIRNLKLNLNSEDSLQTGLSTWEEVPEIASILSPLSPASIKTCVLILLPLYMALRHYLSMPRSVSPKPGEAT